MDGWKTHVPLHYLIDKFCALSNQASAKDLSDIFSLDGSAGTIISVSKELPIDGELDLTMDEWFQGWTRLLELIQTYVPDEHALWVSHFEMILYEPRRADNWFIWLEYDSQIRRRALNEPLDPSEFDDDLWKQLQSEHIAKRVLKTVRRDLPSNQGSGKSGRSGGGNEREQGLSGRRGTPYDDAQRRKSGASNSFRTPGRFRCFVCGDDDSDHKSRSCTADRLISGKPITLVVAKAGGPRKDKDGVSYCFSFNGHAGCSRGSNCTQGKHWCSLCGAKGGVHSAQDCTSL